jgi:hypothetical protein
LLLLLKQSFPLLALLPFEGLHATLVLIFTFLVFFLEIFSPFLRTVLVPALVTAFVALSLHDLLKVLVVVVEVRQVVLLLVLNMLIGPFQTLV